MDEQLSDSLRQKLPFEPIDASVSLAARVAARWWGDRLRQPAKLDHLGSQGDTSEEGQGIMTILLATSLQAKERAGNDLSEGRVRDFERHLARAIDHGLDERRSSFGGSFHIGVDYGPDHILSAAAEAAGIRAGMTMFPWKTGMWVEPGKVSVSEGYGAEHVELELVEPYRLRVLLPEEE